MLTCLLPSWDRACPELLDNLVSSAAVDNTQGATGYLGIEDGDTGFDKEYRIPGSAMKYKCSTGFDIGNLENPEQVLKCTAGRKVDFSSLTPCQRKKQDHFAIL
jgi:hypothetical protein